MRSRLWVTGAVVFLLLIFISEVALSTRRQSPSWDEGDHIYAGYNNWVHDDYSLNPEHPPLVKLIATLPLLPLHLKVAPRQGRYFKDEAYFGGRELIFRNGPEDGGSYSAATLLFRMHMAVLVFAVTLALLLFFAGQEMFSTSAGLIALTLFVFDPTILANAPFVATDTGAACGFFATIYTFYRFIKRMTWQRAIVCGVVLGLALTAKHSTLALLPMLVLLALGELIAQWRQARQFPRHETTRIALGFAAIAAVALFTLWGVYSFHYAMHPSGTILPPLAGQMSDVPPITRTLVNLCARFHILPESYLYGLVDVQRVGLFTPTYFFGKVYAHGLWYYFPVLLTLKFTVCTLVLLALTIYAAASGKLKRPRELFFLALPAVLYLAAAMAAPLDSGVRHVLPIFPFAIALAAAGAAALLQQGVSQRRAWALLIVPLLVWHIADSLRTFPNYIPYANTLWGGSANTSHFFSDSATDWAQQLVQVKQWTDQHHIQQCSFAYFAAPFLLPSDYGIPCQPLPTLDSMEEEDIAVPPIVHGPILVSLGDLNGFEFGTRVRNPYQQLFERKPDAVIANGVAVFYGDFPLPLAASLQYVHQAEASLTKNPTAALAAARQAVALTPEGFDANRALGDALAATGNKPDARAAYLLAQRRIADMEPSAQQQWTPILTQKLAAVPAN
jgi:4-amino-4-deoxy-L-arabinose transferase-like glycosyltransferase